MELSDLRRLWSILSSSHRRMLVGQMLGMIATSFLEFIAIASIPLFVTAVGNPEAILTQPIVSSIMATAGLKGPSAFIYLLGCLIIFIFCLKGLALALVFRGQATISARITSDVTRALFSSYINAPYFYIHSRNTAQCINIAAGESVRLVQSYILPLLIMIMNIFLLFSLLLIVLVSDPLLGLCIGIFAGGGGYLFNWFNRARLTALGYELSAHNKSLIQKLNEGLGGYKHIKLRGLEREIFCDADVHIAKREEAFRITRFIQMLPKPLFETIGLSLLILMVLMLLMAGRPLDTIVPTLTMLGAVAVRALPALFGITGSISSMRANVAALHNVLKEFDELGIENVMQARQLAAPVRGDHPVGDIVLRDVNVRHFGAARNALKDLSLEIPVGSSVAFVGPTGSGKSTAVDTILGFLDIESGDIQVGGRSVANNLRSWQSKVGYIPQEIFLSDASIRRNVAMGEAIANIDDYAVWSALEDAQMADVVAMMPDGLNTIVGERGAKLSGGQRQRIGIARALYHDPEVLVLDEATSALDNETEQKVIDAIETAKRGRTLIMVAHRLSTVRNCDKIFFLQGGRIIAQGTYDELIGSNKEFIKMANGT
ncbi:ABC transporter ATP-binding protein [Pseudoroseicyclus sp. CXY001]|uniref:ABC transporter ATP-binding protein n=1 Tax=Pseudoroseicyclus sp. CXY001 TaxID=3242492 RepID=UPI003570EA3F